MLKLSGLAFSNVSFFTPKINAGNITEIPRGAIVTIIAVSYHLYSMKINRNLDNVYSDKPMRREILMPILSTRGPVIDSPYKNRLDALIQKRMPASEGLILYSY